MKKIKELITLIRDYRECVKLEKEMQRKSVLIKGGYNAYSFNIGK